MAPPIIDESALASLVREMVRAEIARPLLITQKNCEQVVGIPRREYLRLARIAAFASTRERRLVIARVSDVMAYVERNIALRDRKPSNDHDPEAVALSRVGARRVSR